MGFDVVKVFTATKARERDGLGEKVTSFLNENPSLQVTDRVVKQSSDNQFHCLSIILFMKEVPKIGWAQDQ